MLAWVLERQVAGSEQPIRLMEWKRPTPLPNQVLVRVSSCALCRTDLHIMEGDLPAHKLPLILGHQIIGVVETAGSNVSAWKPGERVGIPWLHWTDETCSFCRKGQENLCMNARFTGYDVDGGFAQYCLGEPSFVIRIPADLEDRFAAPMLCGGVIGYRAFRRTQLDAGDTLTLYGFGASAHLILQLAVAKGIRVFVRSRGDKRLLFAHKLGAAWVGDYSALLPNSSDAGIIFAPEGKIVPIALADLRRGGRLVLAGIHMSEIPSFPYALLFEEKMVQSVAHSNRSDAAAFLQEARTYAIRPQIQPFPFGDLPKAMQDLAAGRLLGTAVVDVGSG
jgi:propanol-preferring alcohol dehydrogenase